MTTEEDLLHRFTEGTLSQEDKRQFNSLIAKDKSFRNLAKSWQALKDFLNRKEPALSDDEVAEEYRKLANRLGLRTLGAPPLKFKFWSVMITTVIIIVLLFLYLSRQNPQIYRESEQAKSLQHDSTHSPALSVISLSASWDTLHLNIHVLNPVTAEFTIQTLTGKIEHSFSENLVAGDTILSLYWRTIPSGKYYFRVTSADTEIAIFKQEGPLFVRTADSSREVDNKAAKVATLFGSDYLQVDFSFDLKKYCTNFKQEKNLMKMVGWKDEETFWVTDSARTLDTAHGLDGGHPRYYIATRFKNGLIHYRFDIYDTLPQGEIVKGSTYGKFPMLAVRKNWRLQ